MARFVVALAAFAGVCMAQDQSVLLDQITTPKAVEPGEIAAQAAPGIVDNVMNGYLGNFGGLGSFGGLSNFGRGGGGAGARQLAFLPGFGQQQQQQQQNQPQQAAFVPQPRPVPNIPAPQAPQQPGQQQNRQPLGMGGGNWNSFPILSDFNNFLGGFGRSFIQPMDQSGTTQQAQQTTTAAPDQGGWAGSLFPGSQNIPGLEGIPNFGMGGSPLNVRCYMGSTGRNQQQNQGCWLPQSTRYYYDMLKQQCFGQQICPRYVNGGWSIGNEDNQGFDTEEACLSTCGPRTTTAAPRTMPPSTAAPVIQPDPIEPVPLNQPQPQPQPQPQQNSNPFNNEPPVFLDNVTFKPLGPTEMPFTLQ